MGSNLRYRKKISLAGKGDKEKSFGKLKLNKA